jgi:hypothetical protein
MSPLELVENPAFARALVVGAFGGVGLVLTTIWAAASLGVAFVAA